MLSSYSFLCFLPTSLSRRQINEIELFFLHALHFELDVTISCISLMCYVMLKYILIHVRAREPEILMKNSPVESSMDTGKKKKEGGKKSFN